MAEGSSHHDDRILLLSKVKKICLCFLPLFLGYLFLQNTLNIDEPLAVSTGRSMEPNIHEGDILVFRGVGLRRSRWGTSSCSRRRRR